MILQNLRNTAFYLRCPIRPVSPIRLMHPILYTLCKNVHRNTVYGNETATSAVDRRILNRSFIQFMQKNHCIYCILFPPYLTKKSEAQNTSLNFFFYFFNFSRAISRRRVGL